jgi:hypothetical protein
MWVWGLLECCCAEFLWLELSYVSCQAPVWYLVETYDCNSHRGFPLSYQWPCLTSFLIQLMMHWQNGAQWLVCVSISFHRQVPSCYGRSEQVVLSLICQKILVHSHQFIYRISSLSSKVYTFGNFSYSSEWASLSWFLFSFSFSFISSCVGSLWFRKL